MNTGENNNNISTAEVKTDEISSDSNAEKEKGSEVEFIEMAAAAKIVKFNTISNLVKY